MRILYLTWIDKIENLQCEKQPMVFYTNSSPVQDSFNKCFPKWKTCAGVFCHCRADLLLTASIGREAVLWSNTDLRWNPLSVTVFSKSWEHSYCFCLSLLVPRVHHFPGDKVHQPLLSSPSSAGGQCCSSRWRLTSPHILSSGQQFMFILLQPSLKYSKYISHFQTLSFELVLVCFVYLFFICFSHWKMALFLEALSRSFTSITAGSLNLPI